MSESSSRERPERTQRLIPASTTLLQPGSRYFRLVDALNAINAAPFLNQLQNQVTALQSQVATLQSQMATANTNIANLQAQLDGVHFGAVMGAAPPAAATNRIDATVNGVAYSFALYAP
jgi:uncharacterized protein involved in exopolysaccharide biosynthesis